jgi:hypothetical protein
MSSLLSLMADWRMAALLSLSADLSLVRQGTVRRCVLEMLSISSERRSAAADQKKLDRGKH